MFFPIRTDRRLQHTPWVNYALIGVNVIVFMLTAQVAESSLRDWMLTPSLPRPWQFLTYQFLHKDVWHLGSNMLFLFVFGNSVEDRLGKLPYLLFYLGAGVTAGLGHALLQSSPVLGASGAVCGVTGAYLALFPLSNITIVYWFFFIGAFEVSSFVLICFQIIQDVAMFVYRGGAVAYLAHISGYVFGFVIGMALLIVRLLPREPYDMFALIEHRRRRHNFRRMARQGYQPWEAARVSDPPPKAGQAPVFDQRQQQIMSLRTRIAEAASHSDLPGAADLYTQLLGIDAGQTLSTQLQLDVGNQLMPVGRHDEAARAYELLINNYPTYPQREQVELILGLIYTRYLGRRQRARELLKSALTRLHDPQQVEVARNMLAEIEG